MIGNVDHLKLLGEGIEADPRFADFDVTFEKHGQEGDSLAFWDIFGEARAGRITVWDVGFGNIEVYDGRGELLYYEDAFDLRDAKVTLPEMFEKFLNALLGKTHHAPKTVGFRRRREE